MLFLCFHEKEWLKQCPNEFRSIYYKRYVDDIFVLFENFEQTEKLMAYFNNRHKYISFSLEIEKNNKLSFLDIEVFRCEKSETFLTSIYRKPTFSGMYTNFKSLYSNQIKNIHLYFHYYTEFL